MEYRSFSDRIHKLPYGGDYNPEQWPEEVWAEDMKLFKEAGIDTLTINIFSWAALQPSEDEYRFEKLDKIVKTLQDNGMNAIMATSTAAHPAWMAKKYPEITRVNFDGSKRKFGGRHNSCPNSPVYRMYSERLAEKLAERYKDCENIIAWHISNEYNANCYCENCEKKFREYVKNKYKTIEEVNRVWNTSFWSHTFYDFDEIVAPNLLSECFSPQDSEFQGISLDYRRFMSDSMLDCYRLEYDAIKRHMPESPVTTNLMMFFDNLDYQKWAKYMDFVSWDSYPAIDEDRFEASMWHDFMRSLKGGAPFLLMEQAPNVQNWQLYNAIKRPGVMRLQSFRAVAHGSDGVCFFQMRRSRGACEKTHGAVIDHVGTNETRSFKENAVLGAELKKLGSELLGTRTHADTAILLDYDNWWDFTLCSGPSKDPEYKNYMKEIMRYYKGFAAHNAQIDVISVDDDLSAYKIVIAPLLYMVKSGYAEKVEQFVENGGTFITTYYSGIVDEHDLVWLGGYPGPLKRVLGIWAEEIDVLPPAYQNGFVWNNKQYAAMHMYDILGSWEADTDVEAVYQKEFYAGKPVVTCHPFGKGKAYYIATKSTDDFYYDFAEEILKRTGVKGIWQAEQDVEFTVRENAEAKYYFILNHADTEKKIVMEHKGTDLLGKGSFAAGDTAVLPAKDVMILKVEK